VGRRIAFLVNRFPTISETFLLDEILDLQRRGLDVEIFSLKNERESKNQKEAKKLKGQVHYPFKTRAFWLAQLHWLSNHPSIYLRCWWNALTAAFSLPYLMRALWIMPVAAYFATLLKEHKIDHVHAHRATHPALAAYVMQLLTGIPYSITSHAKDLYEDATMLKEKLTAADFVVSVSDFNSKLLGQLFGMEIARKIHVIHCGIDPERFREPSKRILRHSKIPFTILCVASLFDYKGHRYLVEACARLKEHGIPFRCWFAGEGPDRKKLESQISRLGLRKEMRLFGFQDRQTIFNLMKEADVFALPCVATSEKKQDGIAVALIEAMAVGVPVVATSLSGVDELVEHGQTGLLVPPKDAAALAAAIYLIYSERQSATEMATAGKSKVLNEFNLHMNSGRLYRLLTGIEQQQPGQNTSTDLRFFDNDRGWAC
jgi:colanic acid/amylovoran biosynthesis glycosyltransferase